MIQTTLDKGSEHKVCILCGALVKNVFPRTMSADDARQLYYTDTDKAKQLGIVFQEMRHNVACEYYLID